VNVLDGVSFDLAVLDDARVRLALIGALAVVFGACVLRVVLHRLDERAGRRRAHLVAVAAPPEVDGAGSVLLWQHLAQCERSRWDWFWHGQPHLVFEYEFAGPRLTVRIWVPGGVSVPMVRDAVNAAWPGAQTTVTDISVGVDASERKTR
jgi:hypothetical protein